MTQRLWVGTGGSVTCDEHAGTYLRSAIENDPTADNHITPLDWWTLYITRGLPCETCVPWNSLKVAQ